MMRRYLAAALLSGTALAASPAGAQLVPGNYPTSLDQTKDQSGLSLTNATADEIAPSLPYGDQGYTVNAWANCNCVGNPDLANDDLVRITGYNAGKGPAQVNGLSIYMVGGALNAPHVGQTTGLHVETVSTNSGSVWGIDVENADSPFLAGYSGPSRYIDNEIDAQIGGTQTILTMLSFGGTVLVNPAYSAGIALNFIGAGKLNEFIFTHDGMADVALHAGRFSKQLHPNDGSQSIEMDYSDDTAHPQQMKLTAFGGAMVLGNSAGSAAYAVSGATGIYTTVQVNGSCKLTISGGLVTGKEGSGC